MYALFKVFTDGKGLLVLLGIEFLEKKAVNFYNMKLYISGSGA